MNLPYCFLLLLHSSSLKNLTSATIRIIDIEFSEHTSKEVRSEVTAALQPMLAEVEVGFALLIQSSLSKFSLRRRKTFQNLQW
jgi:hypothetical protein